MMKCCKNALMAPEKGKWNSVYLLLLSFVSKTITKEFSLSSFSFIVSSNSPLGMFP